MPARFGLCSKAGGVSLAFFLSPYFVCPRFFVRYKDGLRKRWRSHSTAGGDRAYGVLREVSARDAGPQGSAVRRPSARAENLRERLAGSLENVGGAHEDAHERISAEPRDAGGPELPHRADGAILLRRRRGT